MEKKRDLIDRNRLLRDTYFREDRYPESHLLRMAIGEQPTVDALEVPCRMGDVVWGIARLSKGRVYVKQGVVYQMFFGEDMRLCICVKNVCRGEWGKNVFATEAEALAAIGERRTDNG